MEMINVAYDIEFGNEGIAFKNARRFRNMGELEPRLDFLHVLRVDGQIVGVVQAKLIENFTTSQIGPIAVHPKHQVRIYNSLAQKFFSQLLNTIFTQPFTGQRLWRTHVRFRREFSQNCSS